MEFTREELETIQSALNDRVHAYYGALREKEDVLAMVTAITGKNPSLEDQRSLDAADAALDGIRDEHRKAVNLLAQINELLESRFKKVWEQEL